MKTKIAIMFAIAIAVAVHAQATNGMEGMDVPTVDPSSTNSLPVMGPLSPVLKLLPPAATDLILKVIVWFGSVGLVVFPFAVKLQHKLADMLNTAAASSDINDDVWLRRLFANPIYQFVTMVLRFAHIRFPTLADLERAIELQREAAVKALADNVQTTGGG